MSVRRTASSSIRRRRTPKLTLTVTTNQCSMARMPGQFDAEPGAWRWLFDTLSANGYWQACMTWMMASTTVFWSFFAPVLSTVVKTTCGSYCLTSHSNSCQNLTCVTDLRSSFVRSNCRSPQKFRMSSFIASRASRVL